jgi:hypothetical protein
MSPGVDGLSVGEGEVLKEAGVSFKVVLERLEAIGDSGLSPAGVGFVEV